LKNKNKIYFYISCFLLLSTIININLSEYLFKNFLIKSIQIKNNSFETKKIIKKKTQYLLNKNIFSLYKDEILLNLNELNFLENMKINKIYPSSIVINVETTDLIGITYMNNKKYFVGTNGNLILPKYISNQKMLPLIFGKFDISDFINLQRILRKQNINPDIITKYYFHKNKRWDLNFKNNILVKLPSKEIGISLKSYNQIKNFKRIKPNTSIDLRIPNRIVINEKQ
tara:strand:+ start:53 stop:736 length:684 start_codon:yes stop_codon:yes gene_type:complete